MSFIPKVHTVESVTKGHPDKVCDRISDAILFACLEQDPNSRVAVETFGCHGLLVIGGEITTKAKVDYKAIALDVYKTTGYDDELEVVTRIAQQSPDIAQGVDRGGAGDQGIMYGYATSETPERMPLACVLAKGLTTALEDAFDNKTIPWLRPDGKSQVTMNNGKPEVILVSCQHAPEVSQSEIRETVIEQIIRPTFASRGLSIDNAKILVNPTGAFTLGGFAADTGLTGRKLMVDSYGGLIPHGGGATAGKDFTKVDRSAAAMARKVAVELVDAGVSSEILISVAYAIGVEEPVMLTARGADGGGVDIHEIRVRFYAKQLVSN